MSDAITFVCPLCDKVSRVPIAFAGQQGRCPGCKGVIEVPGEPSPRKAVEVPAPSALDAQARPPRRLKWTYVVMAILVTKESSPRG